MHLWLMLLTLAQEDLTDVTLTGFQQYQEVSRVIIRTTETAKHQILHPDADTYVVLLENARIPLTNNRRPLDTRFFDSPVLSIEPEISEGPSPSVKITIRLKKPTQMQKH